MGFGSGARVCAVMDGWVGRFRSILLCAVCGLASLLRVRRKLLVCILASWLIGMRLVPSNTATALLLSLVLTILYSPDTMAAGNKRSNEPKLLLSQ